MALPPLPPTNTPRLFLRYTGDQGPRTLQLRVPNEDSANLVSLGITNILEDESASFFSDARFFRWDYAEAGSNVVNPWRVISVSGSSGVGSSSVNGPRFAGFSFRSRDGRKGKVAVYYLATAFTDYRDTAPFPGFMNAFFTALDNYMVDGEVVSISGERPRLNGYQNQGFNAYHQRRERIT